MYLILLKKNSGNSIDFVNDIASDKVKYLGVIVHKPLVDELKKFERQIDNTIPRSKNIDKISLNYDKTYLNNIKEKMYPCTVWGILEVINRIVPNIAGKTILVIG